MKTPRPPPLVEHIARRTSPTASKARENARALLPLLLAALFFALAAGLGVAHVTLQLEKLEVGYALSRTATRQAQLAEERRRLRIEVAMLKSPERVLPAAAQTLELGPPHASQVEAVR